MKEGKTLVLFPHLHSADRLLNSTWEGNKVRFLATAILFTLSALPITAQDLGLQQYLQRLKTAPGFTVEQKVKALSNSGVRLSDRGFQDLQRITADSTGSYGADSWSSTRNRASRFTYHNSSSGVSGTSQRLGPFTYHNFNNGLSGTSTRLGNQTHHNFDNGLSGSTNRLGKFRYHNFNNGVSGTSQRIGGFTFHNFSDGTNCTSNSIGSFTYTNCN